MVIRRTITVDEFVNKFINTFRGKLLEKKEVEIDFTTAINMFAEVGIKKMMENSKQLEKDEAIDYILEKYCMKNKLEILYIIDQLLK
jgi:hypothetical protein